MRSSASAKWRNRWRVSWQVLQIPSWYRCRWDRVEPFLVQVQMRQGLARRECVMSRRQTLHVSYPYSKHMGCTRTSSTVLNTQDKQGLVIDQIHLWELYTLPSMIHLKILHIYLFKQNTFHKYEYQKYSVNVSPPIQNNFITRLTHTWHHKVTTFDIFTHKYIWHSFFYKISLPFKNTKHKLVIKQTFYHTFSKPTFKWSQVKWEEPGWLRLSDRSRA